MFHTLFEQSRPEYTLHGHAGSVHDLVFSPDGALLASAGGADGKVYLWEPNRIATLLRG